MRPAQARALLVLRRAILVASLAGVAYLAWRFGRASVPAGVDPALGLRPGEALIVDRRAPRVAAGDVVLWIDLGGLRRLGRVESVDRAGAGGGASAVTVTSDGATVRLEPAQVAGRVILTWPF